MKPRASLFFLPLSLLAGVSLAGCTQPWNSMAAEGTKNAPPPIEEDFHSRVIETPAIDIFSGGDTATYPCERTNFELFNEDESIAPLGVLFQQCSGCHGTSDSGGAVPGFDYILDVATLIDPASVTVGITKGQRLVIPGDPDNSYIFRRMRDGEMPPRGTQGNFIPPPLNIPSTSSQASIVYEWIAHCLNAEQPPVSAPGGGGGPGPGGGSGGTSGGPGGGTGGASGGGTGGAAPDGTGGTTGAGGRGGRGGGRGGAGGGA